MKFFEEPEIGELTSSPVIKRFEKNPVLKASDVPYKTDLVCNAGVTKFNGKYVMVFRNDFRLDEYTVQEGVSLGLAFSDDGINWAVRPKPCLDPRAVGENVEFLSTYDARLTVIDGRCYMAFGVDTRHGVRCGIAVTDDFEKFEILSVDTPDNRNFVIFPEKIGGHYIRLERPFPIYGRPGYPERFDIWISESPDLVYWGKPDLLLGVEDVPFSNQKIGPGPPPVKTSRGWLTVFHGSDYNPSRGRDGYEQTWKKRYSAGVMLLDLENPRKVIGMSKKPLLTPEAPYETTGGYRNKVVFPTGMILEESGEVRIYYGAADTVVCLATAQLEDLLGLCVAPRFSQ